MKYLRLLFGIFYMGRKTSDYKRVEQFRELLRKYGYFQGPVLEMKSRESTAAILREQPLLEWKSIGLERLAKLPPDTLGHQYAHFLAATGLAPLSYVRDANLNDEEYFIRRVVQTHDLWHIVLDYKPDDLGEIGLSTFMLAQIHWPPAGFYLGGYILRQMFRAPREIGSLLDVIAKGWTRGKTTRPLFAVRWEDQLERKISDIRKDLGIDVPNSTVRAAGNYASI